MTEVCLIPLSGVSQACLRGALFCTLYFGIHILFFADNRGKGKIAKEIEKYFETKVEPATITSRVFRKDKSVSNETPTATTANPEEIPENQEIKSHGGKREGAGRPPKLRL